MSTSKKNGSAQAPAKKGERAAAVSSKDLPKKTLEDPLKVARAIKDNYGKEATWEDIAKAMGFSPNNPNNQYFLWSATAYSIVDKDDTDNYKVTDRVNHLTKSAVGPHQRDDLCCRQIRAEFCKHRHSGKCRAKRRSVPRQDNRLAIRHN